MKASLIPEKAQLLRWRLEKARLSPVVVDHALRVSALYMHDFTIYIETIYAPALHRVVEARKAGRQRPAYERILNRELSELPANVQEEAFVILNRSGSPPPGNAA